MAPKDLPDEPASQHRIERLAAVLVAAGRVAPALQADDAGGLVARWWPLPASEDRPWLEALLPDDQPTSHRHLAEALAAAVDRLVRQRLRASPGALASPRRSGRGSAGGGLVDGPGGRRSPPAGPAGRHGGQRR